MYSSTKANCLNGVGQENEVSSERRVYHEYFTRLVSARSILGSDSLITFLLWSQLSCQFR